MSANYKNWIPKGMIYGFMSGTLAATAGAIALNLCTDAPAAKVTSYVLGIGAFGLACASAWCIYAYSQFSYNGKRKLSKQIVEGVADYIDMPENSRILDVGCGSGALTIATAKRNPKCHIVGCDRWGLEYASFSKKLCEENASAENVSNVEFVNGDATHLPFEDESFDCITSNYVYHNIPGDKQKWVLESLRVLKKGGTFVIHDLMSKWLYGDIRKFMQTLREMGFQDVKLIDTTQGKFMTPWETKCLGLGGSSILYGKK